MSRTRSLIIGLVVAVLTLVGWEVTAAVQRTRAPAPAAAAQPTVPQSTAHVVR
jgi:hypothetical protein